MERFSKVKLTDDQRLEYIQRRVTKSGQTDEVLLGEIIAQTTPGLLPAFCGAYPHIFPDQLETLAQDA